MIDTLATVTALKDSFQINWFEMNLSVEEIYTDVDDLNL